MPTLEEVRDKVSDLGTQLIANQTNAAVAVGFMSELMVQLVWFIDIAKDMRNQQGQLQTQTVAEVGSIMEKIMKQQGALDLIAAGGGARGQSRQTAGILESKAVSGLVSLSSDKTTFRNWNEKLINAVSQVRYGSRKLFLSLIHI